MPPERPSRHCQFAGALQLLLLIKLALFDLVVVSCCTRHNKQGHAKQADPAIALCVPVHDVVKLVTLPVNSPRGSNHHDQACGRLHARGHGAESGVYVALCVRVQAGAGQISSCTIVHAAGTLLACRLALCLSVLHVLSRLHGKLAVAKVTMSSVRMPLVPDAAAATSFSSHSWLLSGCTMKRISAGFDQGYLAAPTVNKSDARSFSEGVNRGQGRKMLNIYHSLL